MRRLGWLVAFVLLFFPAAVVFAQGALPSPSEGVDLVNGLGSLSYPGAGAFIAWRLLATAEKLGTQVIQEAREWRLRERKPHRLHVCLDDRSGGEPAG